MARNLGWARTASRNARLVATPRMRYSRKALVHAGNRLARRSPPRRTDFLQKRIVPARHHRAGMGCPAIDADAESRSGAAIGDDAAIIGNEEILRVFGSDAALQGMSAQVAMLILGRDAGLIAAIIAHRADALAFGDTDLGLDDIQIGHTTSVTVYSTLDARIRLRVKQNFSGIGIEQEFDRPCAHIIGAPGDLERGLRTTPGALRDPADRARVRARSRFLVAGAGSNSRARYRSPERRGRSPNICRFDMPGTALAAFPDRLRPCRRRPWPRAGRVKTASSSAASFSMGRMPRPPPPQDAFSITG